MLSFHLRESSEPAKGCVIWLHGLGADASDMMAVAAEASLSSLPLNHMFVDAPVRAVTLNAGMPMRAWYDVTRIELTALEDQEGILCSQQSILDLIQYQLDRGFKEEQIFLAGFSQGGAISLYTALHSGLSLGGVVALSSYLPLSQLCQPILANTTPIFMALGLFDPLVLPDWTQRSYQWLLDHGYRQVVLKKYPMEHSICAEELKDLSRWFNEHAVGA